jgi:hypothetical protein
MTLIRKKISRITSVRFNHVFASSISYVNGLGTAVFPFQKLVSLKQICVTVVGNGVPLVLTGTPFIQFLSLSFIDLNGVAIAQNPSIVSGGLSSSREIIGFPTGNNVYEFRNEFKVGGVSIDQAIFPGSTQIVGQSIDVIVTFEIEDEIFENVF